MLDLAGLKDHPEIIAAIDWEMTPRRAFEAYQIKSPGNWRHRALAEVYYFYLSVWRGESRLLLVKKDYVASEEIAEVVPPAGLAARCAEACLGEQMPRGQCALDEPLKNWLRSELGL